jgi:hypothetical protein
MVYVLPNENFHYLAENHNHLCFLEKVEDLCFLKKAEVFFLVSGKHLSVEQETLIFFARSLEVNEPRGTSRIVPDGGS